MNFKTVLKNLNSLGRMTDKHDIGHTRQLLKLMGEPEKSMKLIHVAGTNGKGSTCAMLSAVLFDLGHSVGMFTSPHLVKLTERVRIDEADVSEEAFAEAYEYVEEVIAGSGLSHPTYFETCFLIAMELFRRRGVEYAVLETGMGGLLDVTNVITDPVLTILTSISMDHQEYLGDTLEKITQQKAGILKEGVPVVYVGDEPEVDAAVKEAAKSKNCAAYKVERTDCRDIRQEPADGVSPRLSFITDVYDGVPRMVTVPSSALYQSENTALVLKALGILFQEEKTAAVPFEDVQTGILKMHWNGRMQWANEYTIVDGAHNIAGARALVASLDALPEKPKHLLFAVSWTKDRKGMIRELCRTPWESITVTQMEETKSGDPTVLKALFEENCGAPVQIVLNGREAYEAAKAKRGEDERLVIAGSLYFIGELSERLGGKIC